MTQGKTITLSNGKDYQVQPISETLVNLAKDAIRRKFIERGEPVAPPTYTVTLAGGATEDIPHDEKSLETDQDKMLWKLHQDALTRLEEEQNMAAMKVWMSGLVFDMPETDDWKNMQQWLGVVIPTEPMELRYHYLKTEVLKTPGDLLVLLDAVMKLSYAGVVSEADLDAALSSFRNNLRRDTAQSA